jgi:hypothetical protein
MYFSLNGEMIELEEFFDLLEQHGFNTSNPPGRALERSS